MKKILFAFAVIMTMSSFGSAKADNTISQEMKEKNLQIMDQTAIELIEKTNIQILVFSMQNLENFQRAARGENVGTICKKER